MRSSISLVLGTLLPVALAAPTAEARPVVVELFTSQGCSSCPPAEALLESYAGRADLLPLGFHVTYWDDIGWKDTFSFEGATDRQATYARRLGGGSFTPQLVIDGQQSVVGSRSGEAAAAIATAKAQSASAAEVKLTRRQGRVVVSVGEGRGAARVLLVGFDRAHQTVIARGENAGRTVAQANVVRSLREIGRWEGQPVELTVSTPAGVDLAVILQQADGRILGAARLGSGA